MLIPDQKDMVPRYFQIFQDIYNKIEEGVYNNGDKLPSETDMCEYYNVSRGTIREALKSLIQHGLIVSERGRGTFVTIDKIKQDANQLMGFTEVMQKNNKVASGKILEINVKDPNPVVKKIMKLKDDEKVVRIIRLRYGDDKPMIIERSYFSHTIFEQLLQYDLEQESIYELLYKHTSFRLGNAEQDIEAVIAGPKESELFKIDIGAPLLMMTRLIHLKDGTPFEYTKDLYRADKLKFTIQTKPYEEKHNNFAIQLNYTKIYTDNVG
ncbi:MAG: GntR family transcriptional regulator [Bacteroidota bacterium]